MDSDRRVSFTTPQGDSTRRVLQILVDTSTSMESDMVELNQRLNAWLERLRENPVWLASLDVAILTFGTTVNLLDLRHPGRLLPTDAGARTFVPLREVRPLHLTTTGPSTPMIEALELGLELLDSYKRAIRAAGGDLFRPFQLLITDGEPTVGRRFFVDQAGIDRAAARLTEAQNGRHVMFRAIGIRGANRDHLVTLAGDPAAVDSIDTAGSLEEVLAVVSNSVDLVLGTHVRQTGNTPSGETGESPDPVTPDVLEQPAGVVGLDDEIRLEHQEISGAASGDMSDVLAEWNVFIPRGGGDR